MVKETSLKIFLTSGITLTVKESEELKDTSGNNIDLCVLSNMIDDCLKHKETLNFIAIIKHEYEVGCKGEESIEEQYITHYYHVPYERISWYMIEEV